VNRIAKWDGTSWSALGTGVSGSVYAFATYNDGQGMALYVGGAFNEGLHVKRAFLAKWGCP
jgi:hypothetical protein